MYCEVVEDYKPNAYFIENLNQGELAVIADERSYLNGSVILRCENKIVVLGAGIYLSLDKNYVCKKLKEGDLIKVSYK